MERQFTHLHPKGGVHMVEVDYKEPTKRTAFAKGSVKMAESTLNLLMEGSLPKGDVVATAQIGGILAAKKVSDFVPLCHPLSLGGIEIGITADKDTSSVDIEAYVTITSKTGAEMEALAAVMGASLTVYDMCKSVDKNMVIENVRLVTKTGGKSGDYRREGENAG